MQVGEIHTVPYCAAYLPNRRQRPHPSRLNTLFPSVAKCAPVQTSKGLPVTRANYYISVSSITTTGNGFSLSYYNVALKPPND